MHSMHDLLEARKTRTNTGKSKPQAKDIHISTGSTTTNSLFEKENKYIAKSKKAKSPHRELVEYWHEEVQRARGIRPIITGKDGKNLKRVLDAGIDRTAIEQAAIYYLYHHSFKTFSPTLSVFLSAGVINGILNRKNNDPKFWKEIDAMLQKRGRPATEQSKLTKQLEQLREKLKETAGVFKAPRLGYEREIL